MSVVTVKRIYSNGQYEMDDERLSAHINAVVKLDENGYEKESRQMYKLVCQGVRNAIGIDNVVGLAVHNETGAVHVFEYDKVAGLDDYYEQKYCNEKKNFYIEV